MRRDMSLVREILLWAEKQEHGCMQGNPTITGYSDELIAYHVHLMGQAGLVVSIDLSVSESDSPGASLNSLSWAGHDFIDACRDNSIWAKAKDTVLKPATGMAFDVLLEWLKAEARKRLGLMQ